MPRRSLLAVKVVTVEVAECTSVEVAVERLAVEVDRWVKLAGSMVP